MMYDVNPATLIQMIRSGSNPQQLLMSVLSQNKSPLNQNLLQLARQGNSQEIEKIVRNLYAQRGGKDFDKDFMAFKQSMGL
jgi:hypothetical protein